MRVVTFIQDANHEQQLVHYVSPVTSSSPSPSGSTPAPTVNTPASPPSQPVSLPDTNALAQAISRALAESLPPLLSSLRDSSGGKSNMAATPVPLSPASTSTQSPASSSSDMPDSTSQSGGRFGCLFSSCHVLCQLACSGWGLLWWRDRN